MPSQGGLGWAVLQNCTCISVWPIFSHLCIITLRPRPRPRPQIDILIAANTKYIVWLLKTEVKALFMCAFS